MSDQVSQRSSTPVAFIAAVGFGCALFGLWRLKHDVIVRVLMTLCDYEARPLSSWSTVASELRQRLAVYFHYSKVVSFPEAFVLAWQIGAFYLGIPIAFAGWAARRAMRHPIVRARRVHSVQTLLEAQSKSFSAVAPVLRRDLSNDRSSEWASSIHPEEWVAQHRLIGDGKFDADRARALLAAQLGKPIESFAELSGVERALFAVFGLRVFFKEVEASKALVDALNYSADNPQSKPNLKLADDAFKRCAGADQAKRWLRKHRYPRTLLMALLIEARQLGVLPSSTFIWLKPLDRALWYPLNTAGRKVPFMESAGVFNHWQAEQVASENDCELSRPHVEDALVGLRRYIEDTGLLATPQSDQQ
ncbi:conjugal transfer protein TrbA [Trinickia dinghuensis]|uniref:Conjugal transfer protein TrbA n=1 Tax=Trinickia dinghuensis TaxID=2291023 RepID=A0A3D8K0Y5_9BURK|nr:conjugal transfer protein TrbA [Trinickia dinghuensis]RDU98770.1 conjugal transfer protein TrbA [Trinickia dinghuensis]